NAQEVITFDNQGFWVRAEAAQINQWQEQLAKSPNWWQFRVFSQQGGVRLEPQVVQTDLTQVREEAKQAYFPEVSFGAVDAQKSELLVNNRFAQVARNPVRLV